MRFFWPESIAYRTALSGMARWIPLLLSRHPRARDLPKPPFGWRYMREFNRHAVMLMPVWLYWPVYAWRYRWNIVFGPLVDVGFWDLPADGDYYWNGRWNWRWWRGMERSLRPLEARGWMGSVTLDDPAWRHRNWFQRLGWWIEGQMDDWNERMPHVGIS